MKLKILGLDEKEKDKIELVESLLTKEGEKLERKIGEEIFIEFIVKTYGKMKVNEFEIVVRVFCSEKTKCSKHFFEANVVDRDLIKGTHKILDKLDNEVEHKMHMSDHRKK